MFHDELNIVKYVEHNFPNNIVHITDANLREEFQNIGQGNTEEVYPCLLASLKVALSCTCQFPTERINMREASTKLKAIQASYL